MRDGSCVSECLRAVYTVLIQAARFVYVIRQVWRGAPHRSTPIEKPFLFYTVTAFAKPAPMCILQLLQPDVTLVCFEGPNDPPAMEFEARNQSLPRATEAFFSPPPTLEYLLRSAVRDRY
jgi:hypothetical protein